MTLPDLSSLIPSKYKTYVAALSGILAITVPQLLQWSAHLAAPWPLVIGIVIALLGALGVYHAPYVPENAAIVHKSTAESVLRSQLPAPGAYKNPWPKP